MSTNINRTFTTAGNYTYDSDLIEVTEGVARLKSLAPTDSMAWATFTSDQNLNHGGGTLTGTLTNATVSSGWLNMTGGTVKYCSWAGTDNFDFIQEGTIKFIFKPNYNSAPTNNSNVFIISKEAGNWKNAIIFKHQLDSGVIVQIYDKDTVSCVNQFFGTWTPVQDTEYEIEINFDLSATVGNDTELRIFINGTQFGSTSTGWTCERDSEIGLFRFGSDPGGTTVANFSVNDIVSFSTVQHTSNYTPGYTLSETLYTLTNPTIKYNDSFLCTDIYSLAMTSTIDGSDAIKFALERNTSEYYWTGSAVASSDGYTKTNVITELTDSVLDNFTNNNRYAMRFIIYLHSDDGTTTPEIDLLSFTINSAIDDPTTNTLINLEGFIYNSEGPISNIDIKIRPYQQGRISNGIFHYYAWTTLDTTDSDGHFSGFVYYMTNNWELKIGKQRYYTIIPDQAEVNLKDLTLYLVEN